MIIPPGRVRSIKSSPSPPPAPLHIVSWCYVRCVANSGFTSVVACFVSCEAAAPVNAFQTGRFEEVSSWQAMEISHLEWNERPGQSSTGVFYGRFDPRTLLRTFSPLETNKQSFK